MIRKKKASGGFWLVFFICSCDPVSIRGQACSLIVEFELITGLLQSVGGPLSCQRGDDAAELFAPCIGNASVLFRIMLLEMMSIGYCAFELAHECSP
jgi:hypothetical protein